MQHLVLLIKEEDWGRLCSSCLLVIHQCHQVCLCRLRNKPHVTPLCCHGNLIILTWGLDEESKGVWRVMAPVRMWPWKYPKYWGEIHHNQKDKISVFAAPPLMKWWSHLYLSETLLEPNWVRLGWLKCNCWPPKPAQILPICFRCSCQAGSGAT